MSSYASIHDRIWSDPRFLALSPLAQRLYLYLHTCPHRNKAGLYRLHPGYACVDLRCSEEQFREWLAELLGERLVEWDDNGSVILLPRFLRYNALANPNIVASAVRELTSLPDTPLFGVLAERLAAGDNPPRYRDLQGYAAARFAEGQQRFSNGSATVAGTVPPTVLNEAFEPTVAATVGTTVPSTMGNGNGNGTGPEVRVEVKREIQEDLVDTSSAREPGLFDETPHPLAVAVGRFVARTGSRWTIKESITDWAIRQGQDPRYAGLDLVAEVEKAAEWHEGRGTKVKAPNSTILSWLGIAAERRGGHRPTPNSDRSSSTNRRVSDDEPYMPTELV